MRIVVSVTSYRRRLNVLLPEALKSVINQNVKPDLVVVYVTETDYSNIDNGKFGIDGVEFRVVPDYMSYKKYWALSEREFDNDFVWVIDDDMIYRNDNLDFLNEPLENIVYAYGVQPIVRRPIFNNPFELSGKEVDKDFLLYSGVGVFFPPNVMRFSKELLEMAFRVSPTNDDAFFSAYMRSNSIRVKSIKVERGKNFRNLPPCTSERSLLDTNIFSFDTQVINCYKYFGINLNI